MHWLLVFIGGGLGSLARHVEGGGHLRAFKIAMAGEDPGAVKQASDFGGDTDLAGLAANFADARVEWLHRALERVDRQCAGAKRRAEHPLGGKQRVERNGGRGLGAVDQGEPFLGAELERLHERVERVIDACRIVAEASGTEIAHQLGLGTGVSKSEASLLDSIGNRLRSRD